MKVLFTGDRKWKNRKLVELFITGLNNSYPGLTLIHGAAPGLDCIAGEIACELLGEENVAAFPAEWTKYGRAAGPIRNELMLEQEPDMIFAFHNNLWEESIGTKHMVLIGKKAGIPAYLISEVE